MYFCKQCKKEVVLFGCIISKDVENEMERAEKEGKIALAYGKPIPPGYFPNCPKCENRIREK